MMLPLPEMLRIFIVAFLCSAVIGVLSVGALWLGRRRSLRVRLSIIVATTLASVLTGMVAISAAMYLSEHDLYVFLTVAFASLLSTVVVTWFLGRGITREHEDLRALTAEVGDGRRLSDPGDPKDVSETALLRAELVATSRKLADSRDEVAALDRSRRELIAWIAHDLRTPMAGLKALQHTPANTEVILETDRNTEGQAVLTVTDDGRGVPAEALTEVFTTGWRGSPARTPGDDMLTGGAGLGLAIVRGIVEAHSGTVGVSNTESGACFEVCLPAIAPD